MVERGSKIRGSVEELIQSKRRLVVIDEETSKQLARELIRRGKNATSAYREHLTGIGDDVLLEALAERFAGVDWMLISGDDRMPGEWPKILAKHAITLATIDGREKLYKGVYPTQDMYKCDVVHRWLHIMEKQQPGTIRRYGLRPGPWKQRRVAQGSRGEGMRKKKLTAPGQPTQLTKEGVEIPIPTKGEIEDALDKFVQPVLLGNGEGRPEDK